MAKSTNPISPVEANANNVAPGGNGNGNGGGQDVTVSLKFLNGVGKATVLHFHDVDQDPEIQRIDTTGDLTFKNVKSGDSLVVNGVCAGTATVTVSVPTVPKSPKHYTAGAIITLFIIK